MPQALPKLFFCMSSHFQSYLAALMLIKAFAHNPPCGNDNIDTVKHQDIFRQEGMYFVIAEFQSTNEWLIDCY